MHINYTILSKYLTDLDFKEISVTGFLEKFEVDNINAIIELFNYIIVSANSYQPGSSTAFSILKTTYLIKTILLNTEFKDDEIEYVKKKACKSKNRIIAIREIETTKSRKKHLSKSIKTFERFRFKLDRREEKVFNILKKYVKNRISTDYIIDFSEKYSMCLQEVNNGVTVYDFLIDEALNCFPTSDYDYDIYYIFKLLKAFRKKALILNDTYQRKINRLRTKKISKKDEILLKELENIINGNVYELSAEDIENKYGRKRFDELSYESFPQIILPEERKILETPIITIDPSLASLKDDGVSIRKDGTDFILGIHITDVASRIRENSLADFVARQNFKSFYEGPVKSIDMIDTKFSSSLFSLDEGKERPTLSLYVRLSSYGEIKDYYFDFDQVKVARSLTYEEADNILSSKTKDDLQKELLMLYEVSEYLKEKNKGDTYRKIKELIRKTDYEDYSFSSHSIITESMVLYNHLMAKTFDDDSEAPFIYRVHIEPNNEDLNYVIGLLISGDSSLAGKKRRELVTKVRELYPNASYSTTNLGHHGLGLDSYAHSTSPGRRYPDLISQRLYYELFFTPRTIEKIEKYRKLVADYAKLYNYSTKIQPDYFKELSLLKKK